MPDFPSYVGDPDDPRGRWNRRPAVALLVKKHETETFPSAEAAVEERVGDWILGEHPELGKPRVVNGSIGRGWEAGAPVVEWIVEAAAAGIIGRAAWEPISALFRRLRAERDKRSEGERFQFYVSRGAAAALAADDVAQNLGDEGPFEIQAVEEPSGIAGAPPTEISYVGYEPWVVFLRNFESGRRYVVIVEPDGTVSGRIASPMSEYERLSGPEAREE